MNIDELRNLVTKGESSTLEFKATTGQRSDGTKSLTAMLNSFGGTVLYGITPAGETAGQDISEQTLHSLQQEISHIVPSVLPRIEILQLPNGKSVIRIVVQQGQLRPYQYRNRAYKRVGNTTVSMSPSETDEQLLERMHSTVRWENQIAEGWTVADLDASEVRRTVDQAVNRGRLADPGAVSTGELLKGLGLLTRSGELTRAAVVLFTRRDHVLPEYPQLRLRLARFRGTDRTDFLDSKEMHGNAFYLLDLAEDYLLTHLPIAGSVPADGLERTDRPLFPPEAIREALANAFCHRDYSLGGGSVAIAIYSDRLELTSSGALHFGLTVEQLLRPHESLPWNPLVARVFYLRGLIEQWGRGILRMVELMEHAGLSEPEFEADGGAFLVRFRSSSYIAPARVAHDLSERQRAILAILAADGQLARSAIFSRLPSALLRDGESTELRRTREALSELRSMGLVGQEGHGRGAFWFLLTAQDDRQA